MVLRDACTTWRSYLPRGTSNGSFSIFVSIQFSNPVFSRQFSRPSGVQNGSCGISLEILRSLLSNDINFAWIGVWTKKLWLPEVGASELFFRIFSAKIPAKWGTPPTNRELHLVAGVATFLMHPGSWINLQRAGKTLRMKAVVREEKRAGFPTRFPYFLSVFARTVDLSPDVRFWRSWYRRKACATLSLKVLDL